MKLGVPKFSGIALAKATLDFLRPTAGVAAQLAFVDPRTGTTYGWTSFSSWSPATMKKLQELREAMEQDAANFFFSEGSTASEEQAAVSLPGSAGMSEPSLPPGLGDYLGDADEAGSI